MRIALWAPAGWVVLLASLVIVGPVVAHAFLAVLRCVLFAWDRSVDAFYPAAPLDVGLCLVMVLVARRLPRGRRRAATVR